VNISSPIESVVPTLDGPVLEVLAGSTTPLSLSEVQRRIRRGKLSGVRSVLHRLTNEGVVLKVPGGFLLNRQHVAAGAVEALVTLRGEFLSRLRAEVASWSYRADLVGLFGSFARREGDGESDIDILIVGEERCPDEVLDTLGLHVLTWTGNRAQVMALTRAELARIRAVGEPILAAWHRDLETVMGDVALLRTLTA
jgi:predicted nucleotidyltransferase